MMKLLKLFGLLIMVLLIAAFAGGYVFLKNFDLNHYKQDIEKIVYQQTGRQLVINGDAHLGISLLPTLVIDDISLSNAPWASQPQMIKLQSLQIEVAVLPLLQKEIVVNSLKLVEPQIYLETSKSGMTNWDFSKPDSVSAAVSTLGFAQLEKTAAPAPAATSDSPLPDFIKNVSLKNITLQDGQITFIDGAKRKSEKIAVKTLSLSMDSLDSPINAKIDAVYQNQPISAQMTIGSFNNLFAVDTPYAVNLTAQAYNLNAALSGTVLNPTLEPTYELALNLYNPAGNLNLPETTLETALQGNLKHILADIKTLNLANNLITGRMTADLSGVRPFVSANLQSARLDLRSLQTNEPLAFDFSLIKTANASELVPDTPIPYTDMLAVNASASLNIKELIIDNAMTANNINLKAALKDGVLTIAPLSLNFGGGKIDLNAKVNAKTQSLTLDASSKNILLQDLHREFLVSGANDFGVLSGGKTMFNAKLSSQGATLRQLVQNLNGQTVALVSESQMQTGSLQFLTNSFVSQLLSALNIDTKKSSRLDLQCAVVRTDIAGGRAVFPNGIAIQSDKLTLSGNGKINLLNDKLDFSISPSFNSKTGIAQALSSLIKIKGTVNAPQIALDDKQALKTIVGVATTGPAAYIGSKTLFSNGSPCYQALANTGYQSLVPAPSATAQAKQDIVNDTSAALKSSKKAVKKELKNLENNAKQIFNMFKGN